MSATSVRRLATLARSVEWARWSCRFRTSIERSIANVDRLIGEAVALQEQRKGAGQ